MKIEKDNYKEKDFKRKELSKKELENRKKQNKLEKLQKLIKPGGRQKPLKLKENNLKHRHVDSNNKHNGKRRSYKKLLESQSWRK